MPRAGEGRAARRSLGARATPDRTSRSRASRATARAEHAQVVAKQRREGAARRAPRSAPSRARDHASSSEGVGPVEEPRAELGVRGLRPATMFGEDRGDALACPLWPSAVLRSGNGERLPDARGAHEQLRRAHQRLRTRGRTPHEALEVHLERHGPPRAIASARGELRVPRPRRRRSRPRRPRGRSARPPRRAGSRRSRRTRRRSRARSTALCVHTQRPRSRSASERSRAISSGPRQVEAAASGVEPPRPRPTELGQLNALMDPPPCWLPSTRGGGRLVGSVNEGRKKSLGRAGRRMGRRFVGVREVAPRGRGPM
jgi:hypothetical protein